MKKTFVLGLAILLFTGGVMTACEFQQNGIVFPSILEEFDMEEFTAEFFESNTLILVLFRWPFLLYENLHFYTVSVKNGKLNFIIEIPNPAHGGDQALDVRVFAVIIPNQIFSKYEIGKNIVFEAYESRFDGATGNIFDTKNCRRWLREVEKNTVEHRVGYAWFLDASSGSIIWPFRDHPVRLLGGRNITVISSLESLQEYFYVSAENQEV